MKVNAGKSLQSRASQQQVVRDLLNKNLAEWDLNGDHRLSPEEVDGFVSDPNVKSVDAALLATLK